MTLGALVVTGLLRVAVVTVVLPVVGLERRMYGFGNASGVGSQEALAVVICGPPLCRFEAGPAVSRPFPLENSQATRQTQEPGAELLGRQSFTPWPHLTAPVPTLQPLEKLGRQHNAPVPLKGAPAWSQNTRVKP